MRSRPFLISAALVLGLAACGGDDGDSTDAPAAEATDGAGADASAPAAGGDSTDAPAATDGQSADTGGGSASGDVPELDVCALVTVDDVASVVGVTPSVGTPESMSPIFGCSYDFDGGFVEAGVLVWGDADEAAASMAMAVDMNDYPPVEGVGDEAYDAAPAFGVTARSGRYEVDVNVSGPGDDAAAELEQERQLLQLMIDRLP